MAGEKSLIARDRQEFQAADLNNIESFTSGSLQHMAQDLVGDGAYYSGLQVTQYSPTEIQVGSGRYWSQGKIYVREVDTTQPTLQSNLFSLLAYLPLTHKRIVAVLAYGTEIETDVQPRDFLINLETGATEPQAVPMQALRLCNISLVAGVESPAPQVPLIPSGTVLVATVLLGTTGIISIEMSRNTRIPSLNDARIDLSLLLIWKGLIEPQIAALRSEIAALWDAINRMAHRELVYSMAYDLAYLKERAQMPDNFSAYASDIFIDGDETDTGYAGYSAYIKDGLNFAKDAESTINIALLNPADPNVHRTADNNILPRFTVEPRIKTTQYSGEQSLNYQVQTLTYQYQVPCGRCFEYRYGWTISNVEKWWTEGFNRTSWNNMNVEAHNGRLQANIVWEKYSKITWDSQTFISAVTQTMIGSLTAQTFLVANGMWMVRVGLFFTSVGAGDVTLMVTETVGGKPNLKQTMAVVTIPQAQLKTYPTETTIDIPPVFLEPGKRYALCLVTQGNHKVATVYGATYTEGSFFFSTDSEFFLGELGKDLMFTAYAAKFAASRTEVPLQPLSLAGGISDIYIHTPHYVPNGCEVAFEFQVGGVWRRMDEPTYHLSSRPDLIPMRAVLLGTTDIAPMVKLGNNSLSGWRLKTSFTHISTVRTLPGNSTNITVKLQSRSFDAANHALTCKLIKSDASQVNPTVSSIETEDGGLKRHKFVFSLTSPGISTYRILVQGTRINSNTEPFSLLNRIDVAV